MIIDRLTAATLPAVRRLWKDAFGDPDSFIDSFFTAGFSFDRSRCVFESGQLAAALYWFDCTCCGQKLAYVYAVATDTAFRHRGLCHALMEDTLRHLEKLDYAGAVLVPAEEPLRQLYGHMGFRSFGGIREFTCTQGAVGIHIHPVNAEEYARLRVAALPAKSVIQEGATLAFLSTYTQFYTGENLLFTLYRDADSAFVAELLGDASLAPNILHSLNIRQGRFRTPGKEPFSMYYPLKENFKIPSYFGLALD